MVARIIIIRFLQFYRLISGIGAFRIIFMLLLAVFAVFIAYNVLEEPSYTAGFSAVMTFALLSLHITRKDKRFLRILSDRYRLVFLAEYLLALLPFVVISLMVANLTAAIVLLLLCLVIPWIRLHADLQDASSLLRFLINPVKSKLSLGLNVGMPVRDPLAFEWISGWRSYFIVLIPVYLIVLGFSFTYLVAPIGMMVLSLLITGIHYQGEPREFIEIFADSPSAFLFRKIRKAAVYLCMLFLPIAVIALIFQPHTWYMILGALFLSCVFHLISIVFKYALFKENSDLSSNGMIVLLNILCVLLPFFWPLPVIMGARYYQKAIQNLKPYFNDHSE
jgi:hypothetical protein